MIDLGSIGSNIVQVQVLPIVILKKSPPGRAIGPSPAAIINKYTFPGSRKHSRGRF
jgi:hypothetical protein